MGQGDNPVQLQQQFQQSEQPHGGIPTHTQANYPSSQAGSQTYVQSFHQPAPPQQYANVPGQRPIYTAYNQTGPWESPQPLVSRAAPHFPDSQSSVPVQYGQHQPPLQTHAQNMNPGMMHDLPSHLAQPQPQQQQAYPQQQWSQVPGLAAEGGLAKLGTGRSEGELPQEHSTIRASNSPTPSMSTVTSVQSGVPPQSRTLPPQYWQQSHTGQGPTRF